MVGLYGLLMVLVLAMLLVVGSLTIAKDFFQGQN